MAKFLIQGSYTAEGAKGLLKEGGTGRKTAIQAALSGLGGTVDCFYYAFGADDVIVICDMPDTDQQPRTEPGSQRVRRRAHLNDTAAVRRRRGCRVQEGRELPAGWRLTGC